MRLIIEVVGDPDECGELQEVISGGGYEVEDVSSTTTGDATMDDEDRGEIYMILLKAGGDTDTRRFRELECVKSVRVVGTSVK